MRFFSGAEIKEGSGPPEEETALSPAAPTAGRPEHGWKCVPRCSVKPKAGIGSLSPEYPKQHCTAPLPAGSARVFPFPALHLISKHRARTPSSSNSFWPALQQSSFFESENPRGFMITDARKDEGSPPRGKRNEALGNQHTREL